VKYWYTWKKILEALILGDYYNMIPYFYSELSAVKEHDKKVTKEARQAQEDVR